MNSRSRLLLASLVLTAAAVLPPAPADACAVFVEPGENPPVLGHNMILSLGKSQTTLWDQFTYAGDPASFGWILPTKGTVTVGLSSDALFGALAAATSPDIYAPDLGCPNSCDSAGNGGGGGGFGNGGVTILARDTVGPFDTVQLSADDPAALKTWLEQNNYPVPADVQPILDAYVSEGFNFLAVKLLSGQGADAVQPLRVTFDGAMPSFPMRLLNAGTTAKTDVTLFIVSDGYYEPVNAPTVTIDDSELTWDYAADSSDYEAVRAAKLAGTGGLGYLVEYAGSVWGYDIDSPLDELVASDPDQGGYGGDPMKDADTLLQEDLAALHGDLGDNLRVTRLVGSLSKEAFAQDLALQASASQKATGAEFTPAKTVNVPECPPDPCAGDGGGEEGGGCAVEPATSGPEGHLPVVAALGLLGLAGVRAVRRRKSDAKRIRG